jgi:hypothetical protein
MVLYIPKSWIVGFFFAAIGLAAGWMLHASAQDLASASAPARTALHDVPAATGAPVSSGPVHGTITSITADPSNAPPGGVPSGDSSTVSTTTHIAQAPYGSLVGTSEAITAVQMPVVPAGPPVYMTSALGHHPGAPGAAPPMLPMHSSTAPSGASQQPTSPIQTYPVASSRGDQAQSPQPLTVTSTHPNQVQTGQPVAIEIPPFLPENLFKPLPGAETRGVSFSEWESYRTDVAGRNIMVTTDDSNVFKNRNGKLNGNTGDTDASGLNITDATDSVIRGTESADEAPYQTVAQAVVDIATANPTDLEDLGGDSDDDDGDANLPDPGANPEDVPVTTPTTPAATAPSNAASGTDTSGDTDTGDLSGATPAATAAYAETDASGGSDTTNDGYDFPYVTWTNAVSGDAATAVHTDEGTTLASGQDALVVGADGFDDDDNRAAGENIVITRDDGNVVLGGTGDVNAQIGDSEQGAVIMDVTRTYIQGGGAY